MANCLSGGGPKGQKRQKRQQKHQRRRTKGAPAAICRAPFAGRLLPWLEPAGLVASCRQLSSSAERRCCGAALGGAMGSAKMRMGKKNRECRKGEKKSRTREGGAKQKVRELERRKDRPALGNGLIVIAHQPTVWRNRSMLQAAAVLVSVHYTGYEPRARRQWVLTCETGGERAFRCALCAGARLHEALTVRPAAVARRVGSP